MIHIHSAFIAFAAVSLLGAGAAAQPVRAPSDCVVEMAYAPDDVRAVIEAWIQAEPACRVALEVRVIPTEGGLYLLALDEHGQLRERIVPDATSAGVLIASWAADDSILVPVPRRVPAPASAVVAPPPAAMTPHARTSTDSAGQLHAVLTPRRDATGARRRISVGGLTEVIVRRERTEATWSLGGRLDVDLMAVGGWRIGAAVSLARSRGERTDFDPALVRYVNTTGTAHLKRVLRRGSWELTPGLGLGMQHGYMEQTFWRMLPPTWEYGYHRKTAWRLSPIAEASLAVSYWLSSRAAITVMPVATSTGGAWKTNSDIPEASEEHVVVVGGMQWAW